MYKVLIVDDEAPARGRLSKAVRGMGHVDVVGESSSGEDAVAMLARKQPDVVFLDIEMPHGDGFYVVEEGIKRGFSPEVIFVTAFDRFAVDAFEFGAIDYLLKPAEVPRIRIALDRAIERLQQRSANERAEKMQAFIEARRAKLSENQNGREREDLWLKDRGQTHRVAPAEILFIEADRDYVKIETSAATYHVRGTIADFEKRLADHGFLRIHRSLIVQKDVVSSLISKGQNAFEIKLSDGKRLTVGRSYNKTAKEAFGLLSTAS
ncbi:MAG: LytTR family DNA-binding domain-containing protein [Pseudomonadota bacterium]